MSKMKEGLRRMDFSYPLFYDEDRKLLNMNSFLEDTSYRVFLLSKENEIVLVGSPANSDKLWKVYKRKIYSLENVQ